MVIGRRSHKVRPSRELTEADSKRRRFSNLESPSSRQREAIVAQHALEYRSCGAGYSLPTLRGCDLGVVAAAVNEVIGARLGAADIVDVEIR